MAWIAILFSLGMIFSIRRWNANRPSAKVNLELTPNCLLTRWPILFMSGKSSLFYRRNYWNTHPDFLTQHGYEVYNFEIGTRRSKLRTQELQKTFQTLEQQKQKYHLIIDPSSYAEIHELLCHFDFSSIASVTCLCTNSEPLQNTNQIQQQQQNKLRGLRIPIEEISLSIKTPVSLIWKAHRIFVPDADSSPAFIGLAKQQDLQQIEAKLLHRAVELAERDFAMTGKHHDEHQERTQERSL